MGNVWNPAPEDREMTGLLLIKACWGTDVQKQRARKGKAAAGEQVALRRP